MFKPAMSIFQKGHSSYEVQIDANYAKSLNVVTEFGFGKASTNNQYVQYSASNSFLRVGVDHPFFNPEFKGDLDNAFVGLRYALARVHRNSATYTIQDPLWGAVSNVYPSDNFLVHWVELTGGFRMELVKHIHIGWNMRMKSIINQKAVQTFPPPYLAGYGRGDKNTQVDFNLYLLYGLGKR